MNHAVTVILTMNIRSYGKIIALKKQREINIEQKGKRCINLKTMSDDSETALKVHLRM